MLDSEFKKQRAHLLRELVEKTNDPFIKKRLLALMSRCDDRVAAHTPLTPVDLEFQSQAQTDAHKLRSRFTNGSR